MPPNDQSRHHAPFGLPTTVFEPSDDLDTLIAEVYAVADQLDGLEP